MRKRSKAKGENGQEVEEADEDADDEPAYDWEKEHEVLPSLQQAVQVACFN
jgi:hypothetical protein